MSRAPSANGQLNLLDWTPPEPVARFDDAQVRAATIAGRLCRAVSVALRDCDMPRAEVAKRMSAFLGSEVPKNMLDAYASVQREDRMISVLRLIALLHATRDRRLLELIAELFGWTVIERKYLPLIELAAVQDKRDELARQADVLRRQARGGGAL